MTEWWKKFVPSARTIRYNTVALILAFPLAFSIFYLVHRPWHSSLIALRRHLITKEVSTEFAPRTLELSSPAWKVSPKKKFTILLWEHGKHMMRRFERSYGTVVRDPYELCSVRNCEVTINNEDIGRSDAVFFHLHRTLGPETLPQTRLPHQRWIFFTDESPFHTFMSTRKYELKDYNGLFNWSMTYRSDSDVPAPYGKTVRLSPDETAALGTLPNFARLKPRLVAILGSNCGGQNMRWKYVDELKKHLPVDIYGGCGSLKCPGHFTKDCTPLNQYKFYLAFENSNCKEYLTEKLWWNAYEKEAVPIVMGSLKEDYEKLCPPNSFIHVDDFTSPAELANYVRYLDKNESAYNNYFEWKKNFKVVNEHGYFGSPSLHLCHMCEALNFNDPSPKVYDELDAFWNDHKDCHPPAWIPGAKG